MVWPSLNRDKSEKVASGRKATGRKTWIGAQLHRHASLISTPGSLRGAAVRLNFKTRSQLQEAIAFKGPWLIEAKVTTDLKPAIDAIYQASHSS